MTNVNANPRAGMNGTRAIGRNDAEDGRLNKPVSEVLNTGGAKVKALSSSLAREGRARARLPEDSPRRKVSLPPLPEKWGGKP